jgi:hypothetical protein
MSLLDLDLLLDPHEEGLGAWGMFPHKCCLLHLAVISLVIPAVGLDESMERWGSWVRRKEDGDLPWLARKECRAQAELLLLLRVLGPNI